MINMRSKTLPMFTPGGDYTLWGSYKLTCGYIYDNYDWQAESTKIGHEGRLRRIIKIAVPDHDTMSIDQYPASFPVDVRNIMESRGKDVTGEDYEDSTLEQYEHVARVVLEVAEAHYLRKRQKEETSSNCIHFTHSGAPIVRRYLHPEEELALLKQVIPQLGRSGPARLFLIMMACGFRENECCGFNWSMLRKDPVTGICTIRMPQSTNVNKRTTKLGGKTINAPREIDVPNLVYDLLMKAKNLLLHKWVAAGNQPDQFQNIPLGGTEKDYTKRCTTKDLTDFANDMFSRIGMREDDLAALADDLMSEYLERRSSGLYADIEDYRSCTCYLARRDYASSLPALGVRALERQYSMGHETGPVVDRRIYTSDLMAKRMHSLLQQRPLFNVLPSNQYELEANQTMELRGNTERIIVSPGASCIALDISTEEPGDILEIDIMQDCDAPNDLRMSYRIAYSAPVAENEPYPEDINVLHFYHQLYRDQIADFGEWIQQYL